MKLLEITGSKFPTTLKAVKAAIREFKIKKSEILDDLTVDVYGDVYLSHQEFSSFPVKFGMVHGNFSFSNCTSLTSLAGSPHTVNWNFNGDGCLSLASIEGAPTLVKGIFSIFNCPTLTSFEDFNETLKVNGYFSCNWNLIQKGGLGFVNTEVFRLYNPVGPFKIIEKYLGRGEDGLLECQSELIENGFEDYAIL